MNKKSFFSGHTQLNIIGIALLALLGFCAWNMATPFAGVSAVPLILIAYAAFRIIQELTWDRAKVPTLATSYAGRIRIAEILKREAASQEKARGENYKIIDLGSGRGELTRRIAKTVPQAQVLGIELARVPFWQSRFIQQVFGPKNLSYQRTDFWNYDCAAIDAVVFYLSMPVAQRAGTKLFSELRPGSIVISHTFPLLDAWIPFETVTFRTPFKETIYVYRK